jgi:hypothetical protein
VGPSKTHTNGLGQTDGERFFGDRIDLEFTKDLNHRFAHKTDREEVLDAIMYPLVFELFAFQESRVCNSIERKKILCCFHLKQIRKRCCKKSFDHYNAIPSLNIDCHKSF